MKRERFTSHVSCIHISPLKLPGWSIIKLASYATRPAVALDSRQWLERNDVDHIDIERAEAVRQAVRPQMMP